jgi:MarR family transcriptional regulator, organic hydroperoxide resistance regulator
MPPKESAVTSLQGLRKWREAVPNDRMAHVVKDLLRTIQRAMQIRLAEHSVSIGQWAFLRILWEREGITQRELSELAGVSEPTTYSALLAMEKAGLITRQKLAGNMRNLSVCLTPKGRALKATLVPLAEQVNAVAVNGLSAQEVAALRRTMLHMIANLEADESASSPTD